MSDNRRIVSGCVLLFISLALCTVPGCITTGGQESFYAAGTDSFRLSGAIDIWQNGQIRVNEADEEELLALPGVGETYASLIIAERNENGYFRYPEDLISVRGIGPKTVEKMRRMIDLTFDESGK